MAERRYSATLSREGRWTWIVTYQDGYHDRGGDLFFGSAERVERKVRRRLAKMDDQMRAASQRTVTADG